MKNVELLATGRLDWTCAGAQRNVEANRILV